MNTIRCSGCADTEWLVFRRIIGAVRLVRGSGPWAAAMVVVLVASACSTPGPTTAESTATTAVGPSPAASSTSGRVDVPVEEWEGSLGGDWDRAPTLLGGSELVPLLVPFDDRLFILYTQNGGREVTGEIYDPALGTVELLADSGHVWRYNPAVAWTGSELLVVGGSSGPGIHDFVLAYDPDVDEWRTLTNPPGDVDAWDNSIGGPGVWTGQELLI